jgi:Ca2+-binding RTX toxin-like protein
VRFGLLALVVLALAGSAGAATPGANVSLVFAQELGPLVTGETGVNRSLCASPPSGLAPTRLTLRGGRALDPDVAPLGSEIAYVDAAAHPLGALLRVPTGGGPAVQLAPGHNAGWPAWSADGERVYFSSAGTNPVGGDYDLWSVPRTGGHPELLVGGPARELMATASARSTDLVVFVREPPGAPAGSGGTLWSVTTDTRVQRVLSFRNDITDPDLSLDGQRIVYATPEGIRMLVATSTGYSETAVIARGSDPEFSPDGTRIAFVRDGDVWTMSAGGGEEINVTHSPVAETGPTWQAAGAPAGTAEPCALVGTAGDDVVTGSSFPDVVFDQQGNDVYRTLDGDDVVFDADGHDRYETGVGADAVSLASGSNTADGGGGADVLRGSEGVDRLLGGDGADEITGLRGADLLFGGPGNDRLFGNRGDDHLDGGLGDDVLYGGVITGAPAAYDGYDVLLGRGGNDRLAGGWQKDRLFGGPGADRLRGGPHADHLSGEAGSDDVGGDAGDDLVLARDRTRDRLSGGPGFDRARLDAIDRRRGIERVLR